MNWIDYRERLGIGLDDQEKLQMCKNRIENMLPELEPYYGKEHLCKYSNIVGDKYYQYTGNHVHPLQSAAYGALNAKNMKEFITRFVAVINSCYEPYRERGIDDILEVLLTSTLERYRIPFEIIQDQEGIFIFPKGVEEFDRELVSTLFEWLSDYPETEKAWSIALRLYARGEDPSVVADAFRKALERFSQNFFGLEKTLENLKTEYGRYLRDNGIPGDIAANLENLIQQYTNFMNRNAKHHDRTSQNVLEYIMYQTGNIIRLLIMLKNGQQKENELKSQN